MQKSEKTFYRNLSSRNPSIIVITGTFFLGF